MCMRSSVIGSIRRPNAALLPLFWDHSCITGKLTLLHQSGRRPTPAPTEPQLEPNPNSNRTPAACNGNASPESRVRSQNYNAILLLADWNMNCWHYELPLVLEGESLLPNNKEYFIFIPRKRANTPEGGANINKFISYLFSKQSLGVDKFLFPSSLILLRVVMPGLNKGVINKTN